MFTQFKIDWMSNIRGDLLSGIVVALALIPEAIAFSLIAGVRESALPSIAFTQCKQW